MKLTVQIKCDQYEYILSVQQLDPPQQEQLNAALSSVAQQLRRLADVAWLCPIIDPLDHEVKC